MNTFGKSGIGNESVYNAGFALSRYLSLKYGPESLELIMASLSKPMNYSINTAMQNVTGKDGQTVYDEFVNVLNIRYETLSQSIMDHEEKRQIIEDKGTANLFPTWNKEGTKIAYISNQDHDYFGSTDLFIYDMTDGSVNNIVEGVYSKPTWHGGNIIYSKNFIGLVV